MRSRGSDGMDLLVPVRPADLSHLFVGHLCDAVFMRSLSSSALDRARGAIAGSAAGDALGFQYEFGPPLSAATPIEFGVGFFGTKVGEWTDDTSMSMPILQALSRGEDLQDPDVLGGIVRQWKAWAKDAPDVGIQTRSILSLLTEAHSEDAARRSARQHHQAYGRSGGNGSLMRTGPVALGYLSEGDEDALADVAGRIAQLTHWEDDNVDACVIWSLAIRHAILTGQLDVHTQLAWVPEDRRARWHDLVEEALAEGAQPVNFHDSNGWVVAAFQGALAAIATTSSLVDALEAAIRGGGDTDTVAAITGSLAGAIYGAGALPDPWLEVVHGWPGLSASDLVKLVDQATGRG